MKRSSILLLLFSLAVFSNAHVNKNLFNPADLDLTHIQSFLNNATSQILDDRLFLNNTIWVYPPHLGLRFLSEYYPSLFFLGFENQSAFNTETYRNLALSTQLENGSWKQLDDPMINDGQIDSTILAYWALKIMGEDITSPHMSKARDWILNHGGIDKGSTLTKYFLSLFGQYDWDDQIYIPLTILRNESFGGYTYVDNYVGQWVTPHLFAMSYLRYYKIGKDFGPRFSVLELYPTKRSLKLYQTAKPAEPEDDILNIIQSILAIQQHNGGFGAYTVSSIFSIAVLQDFSAAYPHLFKDQIQAAVKKSFDFIELNYLTAPRAGYKGMLMDGSFWDNALIVLGLAEAKVPEEKLLKTLEYVVQNGQTSKGGFCYGFGFEYVPDSDNTAIALQTMLKFGDRYKAQIERGIKFLDTMQNNDGGFGAFHREKNINSFLNFIAGKITDSTELFDQSSVDLTAHVLETWADYGYGLDHEGVRKAIQYLKKEQNHFGSWQARWAVNFIHTAGSVVGSLGKLGYDVGQPWVKKAVDWVLGKQNNDGGWGESTLSYTPGLNMEGVGVSTPTQTAWVLAGLIEIADKKYYNVTDQIFRGIQYLENAHKKHGEWIDESPVGTGHRGILYMHYPAYSRSFPVTAIARFLAKFGEGKKCSPLNNYCRKEKVEQWKESGDL